MNCEDIYPHIRLPKVDYDSPLTDLIMELEKLRYKELRGNTHKLVFYQIKAIFHMLESIGSSRIEGNNTTIMDYVENTKIQDGGYIQNTQEQIQEILNIEEATKYVEITIDDRPITLQYVKELHQLVVKGLSASKEGSVTPGMWRTGKVGITGSTHVPPDASVVESFMEELIDFINEDTKPKYDLLKICMVHHRFVWIHPFSNGNGRTVRLFTYALLLKYVFKSKSRIINPTAVFCSNRDDYYNYLKEADNGTDDGLIRWTEYVLKGLKDEIEKIDKLTDYEFLVNHILKPALIDALTNKYITPDEFKILNVTILSNTQELSAGMLSNTFPNLSQSQIGRMVKKLVDKKMLCPIHENARKYVISFDNNYLTRSMLIAFDKEGFLPIKDK